MDKSPKERLHILSFALGILLLPGSRLPALLPAAPPSCLLLLPLPPGGAVGDSLRGAEPTRMHENERE